jgi:hypothetical protein
MTEPYPISDHNRAVALEAAQNAAVGLYRPVGEGSVVYITRLDNLGEDVDYAGNILRQTCRAVGEAACKEMCARRGQPEYEANADRLCADRNLVGALEKLDIDPARVLMVGVTGDEVGFGDQLDKYREEGRLKENPEGFKELPGFNAFFARTTEAPAIGSRLADCAHLSFEFADRDGNRVIGFEHGTRPNMFGKSAYKFEIEGHQVSYTEYVLTRALEHYGADPSSVALRLSSSIRAENFVKRFNSREAMEAHLPGWYDAGFVHNTSNPAWKPGDPITKDDIWHADARGLILHDIDRALQALGISRSHFAFDNMLDPADSDGEFSSHEKRDRYGDSRDLYMIAHPAALKNAASKTMEVSKERYGGAE